MDFEFCNKKCGIVFHVGLWSSFVFLAFGIVALELLPPLAPICVAGIFASCGSMCVAHVVDKIIAEKKETKVEKTKVLGMQNPGEEVKKINENQEIKIVDVNQTSKSIPKSNKKR